MKSLRGYKKLRLQIDEIKKAVESHKRADIKINMIREILGKRYEADTRQN